MFDVRKILFISSLRLAAVLRSDKALSEWWKSPWKGLLECTVNVMCMNWSEIPNKHTYKTLTDIYMLVSNQRLFVGTCHIIKFYSHLRCFTRSQKGDVKLDISNILIFSSVQSSSETSDIWTHCCKFWSVLLLYSLF